MTVEIVTHVFGPFYATLLAQQLRSLAQVDSWATVFHDPNQAHLLSVAMEMEDGPLELLWWALPKTQLLNRTIGRNLAAKATKADWVWFADADYLFGPGSLEAVAALDPHAACMYFPRTVLRPAVDDWFDDWPKDVDPVSRCTLPQRGKPIGGCQIVPGHIARTWGYLDGETRHLQPAEGDTFLDTRGDGAYRGWLQSKTGLPIMAAEIPNVMRLRHRIPATSQRHLMTEERFRLYDGTETPDNADAAVPHS